jgi:hypothetical protein
MAANGSKNAGLRQYNSFNMWCAKGMSSPLALPEASSGDLRLLLVNGLIKRILSDTFILERVDDMHCVTPDIILNWKKVRQASRDEM